MGVVVAILASLLEEIDWVHNHLAVTSLAVSWSITCPLTHVEKLTFQLLGRRWRCVVCSLSRKETITDVLHFDKATKSLSRRGSLPGGAGRIWFRSRIRLERVRMLRAIVGSSLGATSSSRMPPCPPKHFCFQYLALAGYQLCPGLVGPSNT